MQTAHIVLWLVIMPL